MYSDPRIKITESKTYALASQYYVIGAGNFTGSYSLKLKALELKLKVRQL